MLSEELHKKVNFFQKLLDLDKAGESHDRLVFDPICDIAYVVDFKHGKCPHSGHADCAECVPDQIELEYIGCLKYGPKFGRA